MLCIHVNFCEVMLRIHVLLLAEITYIMNTRQKLEDSLEVSSAVYINTYLADMYYLVDILKMDFLLSFFICFQVGFVLKLAGECSSWRNIS